MKRIIILLVLILSYSLAIYEDLESSARAEGMGNAFTAISDDPSAMQFNPAGLAQINNISLMGFYKLLYGGVGVNLHNFCVNLAYPINEKAGVVGISLQEMGMSLHSEKAFTLSHSVYLIKDIALGYNVRTYQLSQSDFGSTFTVGIDFGLLTRIYRRWQYGFFVRNINSPQMGRDVKYNLPRLISVGVAYRPTYGINSSLDISKEVGKPTRIAVGQEFQIIEDYLTVRAGLQTEPIRFAFGLRSGYKNIFVDYALTTHSELPLTHNFGILINLERKEKTKPIKPISVEITKEAKIETPPKPISEKIKLASIYFDFDKSEIRPQDAEVLKKNAAVLKENPSLNVVIEGHCDPIGTAEYNLALGWRRATSAQDYLIKLGINKLRLKTISYGEERLVTNDTNEFWKNRRCDFVVK